MAIEVSPRVAGEPPSTRTRSGLRTVAIVALLIVAAAGAAGQAASGHIIPPEMGFTVGGLLGAGIMAIPWRWSPIIPLILSLMGLFGPLSTGFPQYAFSHPVDRIAFLSLATQYGMLLLTAGACVTLLVQAIRGQAGRSPRWATPAVTAMIGVTVGALLIGAIAQPSGAAASDVTTTGTETVHLSSSTFAPDIVALHKGDTLTVVGDTPTPHILLNGSWSASNQEQPGAEAGAPAVSNVQVNNNTVVLGPFTTAGVYHIFCSVHPGMNLTVIVH